MKSKINEKNTSNKNAFEELCFLASKEKWCWKLYCSTCGHMDFRYGFKELVKLKSPEDDKWIVHLKSSYQKELGPIPLRFSRNSKTIMHKICAEANLFEIFKQCQKPDWLGYLGLVLNDMQDDSESFKELSKSWATQLKNMLPEDSDFNKKLNRVIEKKLFLTIKDLEEYEKAMPFRIKGYTNL